MCEMTRESMKNEVRLNAHFWVKITWQNLGRYALN
jgi:hypothetical protein